MKIIFALLLSVIATAGLTAQDCAPGWGYFRNVTVSFTNASANHYQIPVGLRVRELLDEGKIQSDFSDIRIFFAPGNCFPLDSYVLPSVSGDSITIWISVTTEGTKSVNLAVYYGNPDAESVSTSENFPFLDDFSSGEIDPTKWNTVGEFAQFDVTDGVASYASTGAAQGPRFKFARTAQAFRENLTIEYRGNSNTLNAFGYSSKDERLSRYLFRQVGPRPDTLDQVALMEDTISNGRQTDGMYPLILAPWGEFVTIRQRVGLNAAGNLRMTEFTNLDNGSTNLEEKIFPDLSMTGYHFIMSSFFGSSPARLDYLLAYRPLPLDFTPQFDEEQQATPSAVRPLLARDDLRIFPNPASDRLIVEVPTRDAFSVEFYDALGRNYNVRSSATELSGRVTVNTSTLPRGMYQLRLLRTRDGRLMQTAKVVIR